MIGLFKLITRFGLSAQLTSHHHYVCSGRRFARSCLYIGYGPVQGIIVFRSGSDKLTSDTCFCQLTMQQAVLHHYPNLPATYRFTNRSSSTLFTRQCIERFRTAISRPYLLHLHLVSSATDPLHSQTLPQSLSQKKRDCGLRRPAHT